ncbi:unnamed protein product [Boreogadus saida]
MVLLVYHPPNPQMPSPHSSPTNVMSNLNHRRLSREGLLEMEEEDGHGEDQASGRDPPEESDLTAVHRLFEREASKQEQRWRSVKCS